MDSTHKPRLLLSNDDGVSAKGLNFLIDVFASRADLFVMAPDAPRSGAGCSLTSTQPLRYRVLRDEPGLTVCSCSGTPVDCVKLALGQAMDYVPDLILSGVNHGSNASVNAHYSGTMGAAYEGAMKGIPSIAFSLCDHSDDADFEPLRSYVVELVDKVLATGLPPYTCLNVNFPKQPDFLGIRVCRMAHSSWEKEHAPCPHPRGGRFFWLTGEQRDMEPEADDTDLWALDQGYVAVTPTTVDVTAHEAINQLRTVLGTR